VSQRRAGIAAAIIAGGASSRFGGTPKGLEQVGGRRIVDRLVAAARAITDDLLLVSNSEEANQWLGDVPLVRDIRPERGSLVGIHTALSTTGRETLVLAWDMPFVTPTLLELILQRGDTAPFAVIPEGPSGLEPFCALYAPACLRFIEQAIDAGDLRATALPFRFPSFTRVPSADVAAIGDPARLFFNVNTAEDLGRADELWRRLASSPSSDARTPARPR